ncbi:death-on-curing protein [Candidatus Nomurabacteria bacterium RIFCSPLOWO2_01_FULL_42_20]|uniref:Death-on-curing protein n=1 Tax=Candidatus Nomurabacteria bacterium RIFCSPHIGHO2_01_FULL_42_16 TaxID=1801743 RepID=A0A1F6VHF7_9BACT|nr:MAG: death-on-curing protein [Candidatus Nomurabacteria bacterium RIFCSPHIGHO2_01_FULL_42_16]OGI91179.1 MAG: death-on-curing protein [Candidatus Nomurabacteria bacterium RIFCSPLOWO2_01_FULL_42_20]
MKKIKENKQIVIYQAKSGAIELRGDFSHETIWANLNQIADLFDVQKAAISKHLKNIFESEELSKIATVSKMETVQIEGKRAIRRPIEMYNLDAIIAVGYRVNSKKATQFRVWATKTLREHLLKGYTINRKRIAQNYDAFMKAVADIQVLLPEHITLDPKAVLELIKEFASTWVSLDAYDKETLEIIGTTKKAVKLAGQELTGVIGDLRAELVKKGEATELFAQERKQGSVEGIAGNVMQSFGGQPLYPSLEEKAAHLLYFMVKNHPFTDGNKRSGAFAFVWFLRKYRAKRSRNINPASLTALTLLIAESNPGKKEQMVALVTQLLK